MEDKSDKSFRRNIVQPRSWWKAFDRQAKAEGMTISQWMGECCMANLPAGARDKLPPRPPRARPPKYDD